MKKDKHSIRNQIFSGYKITLTIIILLVITTLANLFVIVRQYGNVNYNVKQQQLTTEAVVAHYDWITKFDNCLQTQKEFTGSLDSTKCSLGLWIAGISSKDKIIQDSILALKGPHDHIHSSATEILILSKTDFKAAYEKYSNEILPNITHVIEQSQIMSDRYKALAAHSSSALMDRIYWAIGIDIFLAILAILFSFRTGNKTAKKISDPISAVAKWSKKLSIGKDNINFDIDQLNIQPDSEVGIMIESFKLMAKSIQENIRVIRKVAEGDMTAFVNIRSSEDNLGKNLYHMVQTNDLMFAEIMNVASNVANKSDQIALASHSIASSASIQSSALQEFTETINKASLLITNTVSKAADATNVSEEIKTKILESNAKMQNLVTAMEDIRHASEQIYSVNKTIDDIAEQTNLLALNAAIEAARAGDTGKGFAVVAGEVRELANKSSKAASESKTLIENTMRKTQVGNQLTHETFDTFAIIKESIDKIVKVAYEISLASEEQKADFVKIHSDIEDITDTVTNNAAASQEAAAASEEMNSSAEILKEAMSKFNLRKREPGQAYIPPEKQNDPEFIKVANENYRKVMEQK